MTQCNEERKCEDRGKERKIEILVKFQVSGNPYFLPAGYYLVEDLKKIAGVPECHVLAEIRDDDVDALTDDTAVHISGCEEFKPFPGKGDAS